MTKNKLRQKIVGDYNLGSIQAQVVLRDGYGGEFYSRPEPGSIPRIKVGMDSGDSWFNAVSILHHEVMELCLYQMGLRYGETPDYARDNGAYLFVMNHTEFSEASARTAIFLAECLPDFKKAWKKFKKK